MGSNKREKHQDISGVYLLSHSWRKRQGQVSGSQHVNNDNMCVLQIEVHHKCGRKRAEKYLGKQIFFR